MFRDTPYGKYTIYAKIVHPRTWKISLQSEQLQAGIESI